MSPEAHSTGWLLTGFQTMVALVAWSGIVLLHVLFRLAKRPEADPIRLSGPIE